jgi:predicted RNA-binding Zn-ribbon protein involved in translation (DUF1610 family)
MESEKKVVKFDGKIAYVCPHCGSVERSVNALIHWSCIGVSKVKKFEVTDNELVWNTDLPDNFDVDDVEIEEYECPNCRNYLEPYYILEGYRKWLRRSKKKRK